MGNKVYLIKAESYDNIKDILKDLIKKSFSEERIRNKIVLIKPNLVCAPKKGSIQEIAITNPNFIYALVEICNEFKAKEIIVADGSSDNPTSEAFEVTGIKEKINEFKSKKIPVELIDLNEDKYNVLKLKKGINKYCNTYAIAKKIFDVDTFINLPKLKIHGTTAITVAMKNLVGITSGKYYGIPRWKSGKLPHGTFCDVKNDHIWRFVLDLNKIVSKFYDESYLCIVDGIESCGGNYDIKINSNVVLCGTNSFYVDVASSIIMGYKPEDIPILREAQKLGFGDFNNLEVDGPLNELIKLIPPHEAWMDVLIKDQDIPFETNILIEKKKLKRKILKFVKEGEGRFLYDFLKKTGTFNTVKKQFHKYF